MDVKLLMELFHLPSPSYKEEGVRDLICYFLKQHNIPFVRDVMGNVYNISHKNKPLLSAHMDTVQDDFDVIMSKYIKIQDGIIKGYGVIGGDDKCGIYAILELLRNGHNDVNFLFSVEEEVGGNGSHLFTTKNDLSHILYGLVLDRRGSGDIICENNDYGTMEFENVLRRIGENFKFKSNTGTFSDADFISDVMSCANLSVGYYNAHSKNEFVVLSELQNAINFTHAIIKNVDFGFDIPNKSYSYGGGRWLNSINKNSIEEDFGYPAEHECDLCGSTKYKTRYLKTLQGNICEECIEDLKWEIGTETLDFEDEEVLWGSM